MRSNVCAFLAILLCTSAAPRASAAASLTPLGVLPGDTSSVVTGVSGDGSVIVGWSYGSFFHAFRWTSGGGMVGLGLLPGGLFSSQAEGVSADGSVVVGWSHSASGRQAFRWTAAGGMQGLGDLPGGSFDSWARGVSADGSVIVGSSASASNTEAFRWTSGGGMVGLGNLPGEDASVARAVSGDGSTVVGWSVINSNFRYQAFRWTSDGGMMGLGSSFSGALGVSGDGSIVVGGSFYWTADGGMRALWDVLLSHGVDPAADGWTVLSSAQGISADGNTIFGNGIRNGNTESFVAVIPISSPLPGDFNGDNVVDAADYVLWRKNNIDGESGYNTWRANFGATAAGAAAVTRADSHPAVPEPGAALLAAVAIAACGLRRVVRPNRVGHAWHASCKSARNARPTPVSPLGRFRNPLVEAQLEHNRTTTFSIRSPRRKVEETSNK